MGQRDKNRIHHNVKIFISLFIVSAIACIILDVWNQFLVANDYIDQRFNYSYMDIEHSFYDRYLLFTDELREAQMENQTNESMKLLIIESQQTCTLIKYSVSDYKFSLHAPELSVNVNAAYKDNRSSQQYTHTYALTFVLRKTSVFTYRIDDIICIDSHDHG